MNTICNHHERPFNVMSGNKYSDPIIIIIIVIMQKST